MSRINNSNLVVYKDTTDLSNLLSVFKGVLTSTLLNTSHIYLGYRKPIHTIYIDLQNGNTNTSILVVEKWNGTEWVVIDRQDDTFGLNKSGFIFTDDFATESKTTYQSKEMYWVRLSVMTTTTSISLRYINLVLNNHEDLFNEEPDIELYYPVDSETNVEIKTFLASLISSKEAIINKLNQAGKYKYNGVSVSLLTVWDFLNINELRNASKYYTLYKIFVARMDNKDGIDKDKSVIYLELFNQSWNEFKGLLTIDSDDDGKVNTDETAASIPKSIRMRR